MTLELGATMAMAAASVLLIVQIGFLWRTLRVAKALRRHDERVGQLGEALSLLTETADAGFTAMAREIERLADAGGRRRETRVSVARLSAAARRGQSIAEIAAAEGVSEGEVALRLHMAEQRRARTNDARRKQRGAQEAENGALFLD